MKFHIPVFLCISLSVLFVSCYRQTNPFDNLKQAYNMLEQAKTERKESVISYLNYIEEQAAQTQNDELLNRYFYRMLTSPNDSSKIISEKDMLLHHITHYPMFNDILFIDSSGNLIKSLVKTKRYSIYSYAQNINRSGLDRHFKNKEKKAFVEFDYNPHAGRPCAFFVEPAFADTVLLGWYALQLPLNKLDNILSANGLPGYSSEVLLVNRSQYLLNNSRFEVESTILKQKIPEENYEMKNSEGKGNTTVIDYRGKRVLTSFEVFRHLNKQWLISAKMDEDEVLTRLFQHKSEKVKLPTYCTTPELTLCNEFDPDSTSYLVGMDEFRRIDTSGTLYTRSLFTCTGVVFSLPGKFAYMAHLSSADDLYGGKSTHLLEQMLEQIMDKEITPSQRTQINVFLVAPKPDVFDKAVRYFVGKGLLLSQIKVFTLNEALFADMVYQFNTNALKVFWKLPSMTGQYFTQTDKLVPDLLNLNYQWLGNLK